MALITSVPCVVEGANQRAGAGAWHMEACLLSTYLRTYAQLLTLHERRLYCSGQGITRRSGTRSDPGATPQQRADCVFPWISRTSGSFFEAIRSRWIHMVARSAEDGILMYLLLPKWHRHGGAKCRRRIFELATTTPMVARSAPGKTLRCILLKTWQREAPLAKIPTRLLLH